MNSEMLDKRNHQVSIKYEGIYSFLESVFIKFYGLPLVGSSTMKNQLEIYRQLKFIAPAI